MTNCQFSSEDPNWYLSLIIQYLLKPNGIKGLLNSYDGHNDSCGCCVIFLQTVTAKNCQNLWKYLLNKLCEKIMMSVIKVSADCTFWSLLYKNPHTTINAIFG